MGLPDKLNKNIKIGINYYRQRVVHLRKNRALFIFYTVFYTMKNISLYFQSIFISVFFVLLSLLWQGNAGFSLADEGFFWYGVQRVMAGEAPILDFMAYDPGRYYWSAGLMTLWNDHGPMSLRWSVAIFQALGLFVALFIIGQRQKENRFFYLLISAATLMAWMFPWYKIFDISASVFLVGALAFLCEKPTRTRYFLAGLCVGGMAVFGRNHGVYGAFGSICVMIWLSIKSKDFFEEIRKSICLVIGVICGFLPVIYMMIFITGFFTAFWESIVFLFDTKSTNLNIPVPWPWLADFTFASFTKTARYILTGLFFVSLIVFAIFSMAWVIWKKIQGEHVSSIIVSASFLTLPYAHYAYSRADIVHLALGIFPFLMGLLTVLSFQRSWVKWCFSSLLCLVSLWMVHQFHPGWQCRHNRCVPVEISGDPLMMDRATASDVALLRKLADQYAPDGQSFLATPLWPGAYALLERKSPMWEIYALFPRSEEFENREIDRIKSANPGFVILFDFPLDGRDDLRFKNTHPLIYQYILNSFEPTLNSPNPAYQIYRARRAEQ